MTLGKKIALDSVVYLILVAVLSFIEYKYFDFFILDGAGLLTISGLIITIAIALISLWWNKHSDDKKIEFIQKNMFYDMVLLSIATFMIVLVSLFPFSLKGVLTPILFVNLSYIFVNLVVFRKFDTYEKSIKSEKEQQRRQVNDQRSFAKQQILDDLATAESYKADKLTQQDLERLIAIKKKDSADKR